MVGLVGHSVYSNCETTNSIHETFRENVFAICDFYLFYRTPLESLLHFPLNFPNVSVMIL